MILTIPTFEDPFYTHTTSIEGRDYAFDWRFNQRENVWYFSVALPDGTDLATGVKVVCGRSLLHRWADVRLPSGMFIAVANGDDRSPPGVLELGENKRVTLTYLSVDEYLP